MSLDLTTTLEQITEIVHIVAPQIRDGFYRPHQEIAKSSAIDIATETDQAAEETIMAELKRRFPTHQIVGEETGQHGASDAAYQWYVDPIDGTTNFASYIPHFCTSIALATADVEPLVGVIYDPMRDELYTAIRGEGAHLNGEPIHVTTTADLLNSVVVSGFSYDKHTNPDDNLRQWAAFTKRVRGVRRLGSAALDFAYIAAGRLDGYWERSLNRWDAMAGILLVREAGGRVTDYQGNEQPQLAMPGPYLASNGHIHDVMLDVITASYEDS